MLKKLKNAETEKRGPTNQPTDRRTDIAERWVAYHATKKSEWEYGNALLWLVNDQDYVRVENDDMISSSDNEIGEVSDKPGGTDSEIGETKDKSGDGTE